jgi:Protein of unknown function (DUF4038)/Domain of unknown function (DUF5060)
MKLYILLSLLLFSTFAFSQKKTKLQWTSTQNDVETYDFFEGSLTLPKMSVANPFKDAQLTGEFKTPDNQTIKIEGFCDSQDGKKYLIRFMPKIKGNYSFNLSFVQGDKTEIFWGNFIAKDSNRNGLLRQDKENPWHFIYENTKQHFFWNGTTTYWILGWKDEKIIEESIDRLARLGINRIRVAINGRAHGGSRWNENNVVESEKFTFKLNPWLAANPEDLDNPNFDVTRPNVAHWQKMDRLIARCREKGIIVSFIFYVDGLDHGCDPFKLKDMGNENEQLYYAYAAARYSAYENIMWDIANEYHLFRTPAWAEKMGSFLKSKDPYNHLLSVHGSSDFPFRKAPWVDVVMYQSWDECGGYDFVTGAKKSQEATGRILPTINEEYGYEGHYAVWGCGATAGKERPDGRNGLNRSQLAWEICMAGGYQTTGETAEYGTGAGEDTGGGWINGRGNDKMTMLNYYKIMKQTFEKTNYWQLNPRNDLVSLGNLCLANEGKEYLIYSRLQHCRIRLPANQKYTVIMINPQTGEEQKLADADSNLDNNAWQYRKSLSGFWVFILKRIS